LNEAFCLLNIEDISLTILKNFIILNGLKLIFFCLETKESKVQDLEISAKNEICSLKTLNSCGNDLCLESKLLPHSDTRVFFYVHRIHFLNASLSYVV
jgi:hypothetical protein